MAAKLTPTYEQSPSEREQLLSRAASTSVISLTDRDGREVVDAPTPEELQQVGITDAEVAKRARRYLRAYIALTSPRASTPKPRTLGRTAPRARARRSTRARVKSRGAPASADDVPLDTAAPGGAR